MKVWIVGYKTAGFEMEYVFSSEELAKQWIAQKAASEYLAIEVHDVLDSLPEATS